MSLYKQMYENFVSGTRNSEKKDRANGGGGYLL